MKMTFQPKRKDLERKFTDSEQDEHTRRKKSFSCQKSKRKKTVISLGRIYVAFSSILYQTESARC